ncbi:MAG TPA: CoA transferase [Archaeoglobus sp.]|nr:CoA transferase [Archaeoglobus sp.]
MGKEFYRKILDPEKIFEKPEALENVRVLDLSNVVLGPAAGDFLAEFGAEVIKVELPFIGDVMRYVTPRFFLYNNLSPGFEEQNHNKYHIAIDLRKPEGKELIYRLVKKCDVVIENFRPGTTDKWGIGYRQLSRIKPDIIYLALSGFGQWGRNALRVSYDAVAQAESGLMYITGFPERDPIKCGVWILDFSTSITGAIAVVAALFYRRRTGRGQFIDVSQVETAIRWMDWTWVYIGLTGKDRDKCGNRDFAIVPSNVYKCKDGFIALAAFTEDEFKGLCDAMGREDLKDYTDPIERLKLDNAELIDKAVAEWVSKLNVKEVEELSKHYGFACSSILSPKDVYESRHFRERKTVWIFEDHLVGKVAEVQSIKMSETPGRIKWVARPIGFDNEYIFVKLLGMSKEEMKLLESKGVIGKWGDAKGARPPDDWDGRKGLFF